MLRSSDYFFWKCHLCETWDSCESLVTTSINFGGFDLDSFLNTYRRYFKLIRLDKPVGILLLMWPTLWALFIASQGFQTWYLTHFCVGCNFMRSAGCIANDIIDMNFDKDVSRTKDRMLQIKSFATGGCDTYGWISCCISQFTFFSE